jgi:hypothetical protein
MIFSQGPLKLAFASYLYQKTNHKDFDIEMPLQQQFHFFSRIELKSMAK